MCQTTTFTRRSADLGVGRIGYDHYAIRCKRLPGGVVVFTLRKWDSAEHTVTLGVNNRYRCSCKDHLYRRHQCKHIAFVATHGMDIDPPACEYDPAESTEAKDHFYTTTGAMS